MISRLVRAILILPGTVLVVVPALILWLSRDTALEARTAGIEDPRSWIGVLLFSVGLVFAIWTCRLFVTVGEGTPAPWDPPNKLVVHGPYRHVRNPMITSVLLMLAGEAVFFRSWALAGWLLIFFLANAIYFPLVEEKALERRSAISTGSTKPMCRAGFRGFGRGTSRSRSHAFDSRSSQAFSASTTEVSIWRSGMDQ
jgi:protein-S-isoprenylcysteine O-methyltransferase Ste14